MHTQTKIEAATIRREINIVINKNRTYDLVSESKIIAQDVASLAEAVKLAKRLSITLTS